jgi:Protein of unknown function (DUF2809)
MKKHTRPQEIIRLDRRSFLIFLCVLLLEIAIATFFHDRFVRYFLGDVFIVVLICYFIRSWWAIRLPMVVLGTLIFAYLVEMAQYFDLVDILGWRGSQVANLTIGSTFDWMDLLAYALGAGFSLLIEHYCQTLAR